MLFLSKSDLSEEDLRRFLEVIRRLLSEAKITAVKGNPKAVIVKTTNLVAPMLRDLEPGIKVGRTELESVLTSGAIGNLKKRALEAAANGKVP